jgi:hypothetical protein
VRASDDEPGHHRAGISPDWVCFHLFSSLLPGQRIAMTWVRFYMPTMDARGRLTPQERVTILWLSLAPGMCGPLIIG